MSWTGDVVIATIIMCTMKLEEAKGLLFSHISALCYSLTYSLTQGAQQSGDAVHGRVTHCHKACNDQKCNTITCCKQVSDPCSFSLHANVHLSKGLHSNKPLCITVSVILKPH